jgi:Sec-independent protein translocase protein TatA
MKNKILFFVLFSFVWVVAHSQQQPDKRKLRIVDTLTTQERNNRNPVILKAELDSMIQLYMASLPHVKQQEPVKEIITEIPVWVTVTGIVVLVVVAALLYLLFHYHKRLTKTISDLKRLIQNFELLSSSASSPDTAEKSSKRKTTMEKRLNELSEELAKQKTDYETVMHEYGLIKQSIAEVYKVRNYPLFDKTKSEEQIIQDLLQNREGCSSSCI